MFRISRSLLLPEYDAVCEQVLTMKHKMKFTVKKKTGLRSHRMHRHIALPQTESDFMILVQNNHFFLLEEKNIKTCIKQYTIFKNFFFFFNVLYIDNV